MPENTHIFSDPETVVRALSRSLISALFASESRGSHLHVAFPGGSTPQRWFKFLARPSIEKINWERLHYYWGDERCVPPDHPESNFGNMYKDLLSRIEVPEKNIHRIKGELDPEGEVKRYGEELIDSMPSEKNFFPEFDWIILGLGSDGHTASIFPHMQDTIHSDDICVLVSHPQTNQKRISLSLKTINNAKRVSFLVTGMDKAPIVSAVVNKESAGNSYPASLISPLSGNLDWYLDVEAAAALL